MNGCKINNLVVMLFYLKIELATLTSNVQGKRPHWVQRYFEQLKDNADNTTADNGEHEPENIVAHQIFNITSLQDVLENKLDSTVNLYDNTTIDASKTIPPKSVLEYAYEHINSTTRASNLMPVTVIQTRTTNDIGIWWSKYYQTLDNKYLWYKSQKKGSPL